MRMCPGLPTYVCLSEAYYSGYIDWPVSPKIDLCTSDSVIPGMCHCTQLLRKPQGYRHMLLCPAVFVFTWMLGIELRSSGLCSKHYMD